MDTEMSLLLYLSTPVSLLLLITTFLYLYLTWPYSTWSRLGIPGPKPLPVFGNFKDFNEKGFPAYIEWSKKYGKNVGIYLARTPVLLTTDVELIKHVFITDFQSFPHRGFTNNDLLPHVFTINVINTTGETWKRQRRAISPVFSTHRLKLMKPLILTCCRNLVKAVERSTDNGKLLELKNLCSSFLLDVTAATGFGIETNALLGENSQLLDNVKLVLGNFQVGTLPVAIVTVFPMLAPVLRGLGFSAMDLKGTNFICQTIRALLAEKKQRVGKKSADVLQHMIDTEASGSDITKNPMKKALTEEEIVANGLVLFVAGHDTTANTLHYLLYLLALHPDKQHKLYSHIVAAVGHAEPTYDKVMAIDYLDHCIYEAGRLFPAGPVFDRKAVATRTINGVTIPAGVHVMVNACSLLRDDDYFPHPHDFIPERFEDECRPIPTILKELMFGAGPRQCMGMRLGLLEIKMAIVSLLRHFRFLKVKETVKEVVPMPGGLFNVPQTPILIGSQRR